MGYICHYRQLKSRWSGRARDIGEDTELSAAADLRR
jgi:hypothetical protein